MLTSWGPQELVGNGTVQGARLLRCVEVFDDEGRFAPSFDEGTTREVRADAVIVAIGQEVEPGFRDQVDPGLELGAGGFLQVAGEDLGTGVPGVFACGDLTLGPSSVVEAVASGRRAAESIDRFLGGTPNLRAALEEELAGEAPPPYFIFDEDPMYTKRESELIQQFLAEHGRMPGGDDDLDDLF